MWLVASAGQADSTMDSETSSWLTGSPSPTYSPQTAKSQAALLLEQLCQLDAVYAVWACWVNLSSAAGLGDATAAAGRASGGAKWTPTSSELHEIQPCQILALHL